jgi:hypothetical protein
MPIGRNEIVRAGVQVGEITASAAGDQNLLADPIRAFEQQDTPASLAGFEGTHQAGSARSENDDVVFLIRAGMIHVRTSLTGPAPSAETRQAASLPEIALWLILHRLDLQRLQERDNLPALWFRQLRPNRHASANHSVAQDPEQGAGGCLLHFFPQ